MQPPLCCGLYPNVGTVWTDCAIPEVWARQGWSSEPREVTVTVGLGVRIRPTLPPHARKGWGRAIISATSAGVGVRVPVEVHTCSWPTPWVFRFLFRFLPTPSTCDCSVILNPPYSYRKPTYSLAGQRCTRGALRAEHTHEPRTAHGLPTPHLRARTLVALGLPRTPRLLPGAHARAVLAPLPLPSHAAAGPRGPHC